MFVRLSAEVACVFAALMVAPQLVELNHVREAGLHVGRVFWADETCPEGRLNQAAALTLMDTWQPIDPEVFEVARNDGFIEQAKLELKQGKEAACNHVERLYGANGEFIHDLWNKDETSRSSPPSRKSFE